MTSQLVVALALFSYAECRQISSAGFLGGFKVHSSGSGFLGDLPPLAEIGEIPTLTHSKIINQPRIITKQAETNTTHKNSEMISTPRRLTNVTMPEVVSTPRRLITNVTMPEVVSSPRRLIMNTTMPEVVNTSRSVITKVTMPEVTSTPRRPITNVTARRDTNTAVKESDKPAPKPRTSRLLREAKLIESLKHIGGEYAVACTTHCRYGEEKRHTWQECLERCVENPLMRGTMLRLLPADAHTAQDLEAEVPEGLVVHTDAQLAIIKHRQQKSAEL